MLKIKIVFTYLVFTFLLAFTCNPLFAGNINVTTDGRVGIGTTNPATELAVNGTITTKEVIVTDMGWADYVFNNNYKIPELSKVEEFIKTNHHLPGIPSEHELSSSGVSISKIITLQMAKIEELTLYLIQLNKENKNLKERLEKIEKSESAVCD